MYCQKNKKVSLYKYIVVDFSNVIFNLRNNLFYVFVDEGLVVLNELGVEMMVIGNILFVDNDFFFYFCIVEQVFEIVYGIGDVFKFGGFYFKGCQGVIVVSYFDQRIRGFVCDLLNLGWMLNSVDLCCLFVGFEL